VLTACGLDADRRSPEAKRDASGRAKDSLYYLEERLLPAAPELKPIEAHLRECAETAQAGILTARLVSCMEKAFQTVLGLLAHGKRIMQPRLDSSRPTIPRTFDLRIVLQEIRIVEPYAVAVADIRNFRNIAKLLARFMKDTDAAVDSLVEMLRESGKAVAERHRGVVSDVSGDAAIIAGRNADDVYLAAQDLVRITAESIETYERGWQAYARLCVGVAWRERQTGVPYDGVFPGLTALQIGEKGADRKGRIPGDIAISQAIYDRLATGNRRDFAHVGGDICDQGDVYVRHWDGDTEGK